MMEVFEKSLKVKAEHLDELEHVNNVVFLQWVQDISKEHWLSKTNDKVNSKMYWVVRSHHLEYKKQVFLGDELSVRTFVTSYKGPFSERVVEIYREDKLVVKAASSWCLISRDNNKPMTVPPEVKNLFQLP